MRIRTCSLHLALAIVLASCGDASGPNDAGTRPDRPRPPPRMPDPAALPVIAPCPDGWREVAGPEGVTECDPFPEGGRRTDCAFDEAHFVGTPTCARVGSACPADGWPENLPAGRPIVYVSVLAEPGGDGSSRESAHRAIMAA